MATSVRSTVQELEISSLAAGGDGVARLDGLAVFVPRSAPGDVVSAAVRVQGRFARGTIHAVLRAAPERVDAPCVHFARDNCGGCQWQHLHVDAQRAAKAQLVIDAFARIAKLNIASPAVRGDNRTLAYRRTISLTVRGSGAQRIGGFHSLHDPDVIAPIEQCLIAEPALQAAWDVIRRNLARLPVTRVDGGAATGHNADHPALQTVSGRHNGRGAQQRAVGAARDKSHVVSRRVKRAASQAGVRGNVRDDLRVSVRALHSGDVALVVQGGARWHGDDIALLAERIPACSAVWWQPLGRDSRLVWDRDAEGKDDALQLAASFVQVNRTVAAALHAHVLELVLAGKPRTVVDAYAGTGRLSIALAETGVKVTAVELDAQAVAYTASQLPQGSRACAGRVEALIADVLPADVIVLNPPRSGVDEAVTAALSLSLASHISPGERRAPQLMVYVSCDPATLARDVARLSGWYVDSVTCFDMFPQTSHVETVCVLRPEAP